MSIYKRGDVYWYKFMWQGELIRQSTKQGNDKKARNLESKHRARLAGEKDEKEAAAHNLGCEQVLRCLECEKWFDASTAVRNGERVYCSNSCLIAWKKKHATIPTLAEFIKDRFEPWAKSTFEKRSPQTWKSWYRPSIRAIQNHPALCDCFLPEITSEHAASFAAHIAIKGAKGKPLQASSVNARLRVLRRIFHLAVEWGALENAPKIKLVTGERHRERVLTRDEESKYLAAATPLLADVATVLIDSGMRPEECFRQCWENVTWVNGRHGTMLVTHGKTKAARRILPMTPRVRLILEQRWNKAEKPEEGWIWPADTKSEHIEPSTLKKQHRNALKLSKVRPFVLYSLRHTFLTRLGASGCDVWTLARIAGHSSLAMSYRYVHPSDDRVLDAMELLGGHKTGHSEETEAKEETKQLRETNENSAA